MYESAILLHILPLPRDCHCTHEILKRLINNGLLTNSLCLLYISNTVYRRETRPQHEVRPFPVQSQGILPRDSSAVTFSELQSDGRRGTDRSRQRRPVCIISLTTFVNTDNFQMKNCDIFLVLCSKHRL